MELSKRPTNCGKPNVLLVDDVARVPVFFVIVSFIFNYFSESLKMIFVQEGFKPIKLFADTVNRRAWPGGMGFAKAGGNYAPTILPQFKAQEEHGCAQASASRFLLT